jgi:hypothetical protein
MYRNEKRSISQREFDNFIEYMMDFYGAGEGMYEYEVNNGRGYTEDEIIEATEKYLATTNDWGGGDSFDREQVAIILDPANASRF